MTKNYSNEELLMMDPIEVYKLRLNGSISYFPNNFFKKGKIINYNTCAAITRYLIDNVLHFSDDDICKYLTIQIFAKYQLYGMINTIFCGNVHAAMENAYPSKFKPWQFKSCQNGYWNKETAKEATIWLVEEKLHYSDSDICKYLTKNSFYSNGLAGMLNHIFNGCTYEAINNAYPDKFKPWELNFCPRNYWNKETAKEATIWLVEEKLHYSYNDICKHLSPKVFVNNGLSYMLAHVFNNSTFEAINNAYPGKFVKIGYKIYLASQK